MMSGDESEEGTPKPRVNFAESLETTSTYRNAAPAASSLMISPSAAPDPLRQRRGPAVPMTTTNTSASQAGFYIRGGVCDLETGECTAQNVTHHQTAQDPFERRRKEFLRLVGLGTAEEQQECAMQFRLATKRKGGGWKNIATDGDEVNIHKVRWWWSMESMMTQYLNWTFRTSFCMLVFHFAVGFWGMTVAWSGLIIAAAELRPECLQVGGLDANNATSHVYLDAYALSWTTFSATGYGVISPQVSVNIDNGHCGGMNMLMALEAFVGFLYNALCAAIIYAKVIRVQSAASVAFSNPVVIKFGDGVSEAVEDNDREEAATKFESPFPLLEFRVINSDCGKAGSEIINSTVNCVGAILEKEASDAVLLSVGVEAATTRKMKKAAKNNEMQQLFKSSKLAARAGVDGIQYVKRSFGRARHLQGKSRRMESLVPPTSTSTASEGSIASDLTFETSERKADQKNVIDEGAFMATNSRKPCVMDEGSILAPRRIFSHLQLHTNAHPSFRRVWSLRHELNVHSPLLKGKTRKMIAENGGKWPPELNTHEKIRESVVFHKIIVSFAGTSVSSGTTVYAQKIYDFADLYIGYCFVKLLHRNKEGNLAIHQNLVNDIMEQKGGGSEPIDTGDGLPGGMLGQAIHIVRDAATTTIEQVTASYEKAQNGAEATLKKAGEAAHEVSSATKRAGHGIQSRVRDAIAGSDDAGDSSAEEMLPDGRKAE